MRSHMLSSAAMSSGMMMLALIAVSPAPARSQAATQPTARALGVLPGDRVRLVASDYGEGLQTGTILAAHGDSVIFSRSGEVDSLALPMSHIARLDVSRGRHSHGMTGLAVGSAGGAVLGAVMGSASYDQHSIQIVSQGASTVGGAVLGGLAGALIGAITGSLVHTERWETTLQSPLPAQAHVGLAALPSRLGPRVALRVAARF